MPPRITQVTSVSRALPRLSMSTVRPQAPTTAPMPTSQRRVRRAAGAVCGRISVLMIELQKGPSSLALGTDFDGIDDGKRRFFEGDLLGDLLGMVGGSFPLNEYALLRHH